MRKQFINKELYQNALHNLKAKYDIDFESIARRAEEKKRDEASRGCNFSELYDLLEGKFATVEKKRVEAHVDFCHECRELLVLLRGRNSKASLEFRHRLLPKLREFFRKPLFHTKSAN